MLHSIYRIGLTVVFCGLLLLPGASWGQKKEGAAGVRDEADLFGKDALNQANEIIARIKEKHQKDLRVDTVLQAPEDAKAFDAWVLDRAKNAGIDGVYI